MLVPELTTADQLVHGRTGRELRPRPPGLDWLRQWERSRPPTLLLLFARANLALLEGPADERLRLADQLADEMRVSDPCGLYYLARHLARAGHPRALSVLQRSVNGGFVCRWFLNEDPWLDAVRGEPGFDAIVEQATARIHAAREAFRQADGDRVLGLVGAASATGA